MRLFTKDIDKKLFAQYPKGNNLEEQMAVAKIFNPYHQGRWYLLNSDPEDPDYLWAIVQMGQNVEIGSVSRSELENLRISAFRFPLERDLSFRPVNAYELWKGLRDGKFYKEGGWTEGGENKAMLLNQAEGFEHHAEELESAAKKAEHVPAWVVAKSERASTDLSDITHYLDGENEQKREEIEGEEEYAQGGEVKWADADYGDSALVVSENKMGIIIKPYGRKFHLRFVDGTEKTYDANDLKFFKDIDDFDRGGDISSPNTEFMKWFVDWSKSVNKYVYVSMTIPNEFSSPIKDGKGKIVILDVIEKKGDTDAKKYFNEILKKADEFGVSIYLQPIPRTHNLESEEHKKKITKDYLIKYYEKFGFENMDGGFMVREPKMAKGGELQSYSTLSFKTKKSAEKNEKEIKDYFSDRLKSSEIVFGRDERGNDGYFVKYDLKPDKMASGGEIKKGDFVIVDNPYWKASMGKEKPVKRKVTMVVDDNVFFSDGSNSSMEYVKKMEGGGMMAKGGDDDEYSDGGSIKSVNNSYIEIEHPFDNNTKTYTLLTDVIVQSNNKIGKDEVVIKSNDLEEVVKKSDWDNLLKLKSVDDFPSIELYKYLELNDKEKKEWYWRAVKNHGSFSHLKNWRIIQGKIMNDPLRLGHFSDGGSVDNARQLDKDYFMTVAFEQKQRHGGYGINRVSTSVRAKNKAEAISKAKKFIKKEYRGDMPIKNLAVLENTIKVEEVKYEEGGGVKFSDKVASIKASLLKRKKVSPKVQKDYGKTYSPKEAEESARRIVGAMTAKERLQAKLKKRKK